MRRRKCGNSPRHSQIGTFGLSALVENSSPYPLGLLVGLVLTLACGNNDPPSSAPESVPTSATPQPEPSRPESSQGLEFAVRGSGDKVVVLLHGYGARGTDLVPMGEALASETDMRWVMPAAPRESGHPGGRAWFLPGNQATAAAQISSSRSLLLQLVRSLKEGGAEKIAVAGFSQGAMMALDLLLMTDAPIDAVGALSGSPLPHWGGRYAHDAPIFVAHGRTDSVLPFSEAGEMRTLLGENVEWLAFDGGHTIPTEVKSALAVFLLRSM